MLMLDKDQSFSLSAYVTSPGYQRIALTGYLTEYRGGELWAAPLLPELFYGADGLQLTSWRQNLPTAGNQVVLSRSGGQPSLPREELYWRKIKPATTPITAGPAVTPVATIPPLAILVAVVGIAIVGIAYLSLKRK